MNRDLEQRYAAIAGDETTTCAPATPPIASRPWPRRLFDESLGYGYDNDMSYRLAGAGYRLRFCRRALSVHRWREGFLGYVVQQYGFGYGRLDLVWRHRGRFHGDSVSPAAMMVHAPLMAAALGGLLAAGILASVGGPARPLALASMAVIAGLACERLVAGVAAVRRFGDISPLAFPVVHLVRDLAWVVAIVRWSIRRLTGRPTAPAHSMRGRPGALARERAAARETRPPSPQTLRAINHDCPSSRVPPWVLCVIPAYNEAANLTAVVDELRGRRPEVDVLVADDGSTDGTPVLVPRLDVRWLRFSERLGIGNAVRAGLRYADRAGYDAAVRMDGDGQHRVEDLERLLEPIIAGRADVVLGSRYADARPGQASVTSLVQRFLALSVLVDAQPHHRPDVGILCRRPAGDASPRRAPPIRLCRSRAPLVSAAVISSR